MPQYTLRLLPPPAPPPPVALKAQTLPCAGQWWWENSPTAPLACESGVCSTVLTSRFDGGIWVRAVFEYDIPDLVEGEPLVAVSEWSNIIDHGCEETAPPQPVPEPGLFVALVLGCLTLVALRRLTR